MPALSPDNNAMEILHAPDGSSLSLNKSSLLRHPDPAQLPVRTQSGNHDGTSATKSPTPSTGLYDTNSWAFPPMERQIPSSPAPVSKENSNSQPEKATSAFGTVSGGHPTKLTRLSIVVENNDDYATGLKLATVICSVTLVAFLMTLDQSIITTAIPQITSDFHSLPDVGWYGSSYLLASASLQPLTGKIYTYFSSKYTFLTFLALFELGSLLCGIANSSKMLIVGRAVAGLGSSGLINGALTIIAACVPLAKRPVYLGVMMSVSQIGLALGPLIGGVLTQYTTWRWCFYINLPVGGATAALLLIIRIPERNRRKTSVVNILRQKLDLVGFAIFAPAAVQFFLALEWGGVHNPWDSATIIGLFCGAAATFGGFLAWEYRKGDAAMIPLSMMARRVVWSGALTMLFFMGGSLSMSYYLPMYFQAVKGVSPTLSGVYLLPSILGQMAFSIVSGLLVTKIGYYLPWSIISAIWTAFGYGLLSTLTPTSSTEEWVGFQIITGIGRGCGLLIPIIALQHTLPAPTLPIAMALIVFAQTLGGAIFLALSQTVFLNSLPHGDAMMVLGKVGEGELVAYDLAINRVFYVAVGAAVAMFVCCWGMGWGSVKDGKGARKGKKGEVGVERV